jgi:hypothetical protein
MRRIKKAQTGTRASSDNTRVKKSATPPPADSPKYKYIERYKPLGKYPNAEDSAQYKRGYSRGIRGKGYDMWSGSLSNLAGWQEGEENFKKPNFKKQRSGGKIKPKASNVSKKLGSAKKSIGNMRFAKKKK